jgi:hypothetical protein
LICSVRSFASLTLWSAFSLSFLSFAISSVQS